MTAVLQSVDDLQQYLAGVNDRAQHHAHSVNEAVLALAGAIVLFKDPGTDLEVKTYAGETANILWAMINGRKYAFAYHHDGRIEVRDRTLCGDVVASIQNDTPIAEILRTFERLSGQASVRRS
jgi:hypothetical protein